jgi:exopolysaccharide biosynthesis polyprenyl glycosylphosphotransferase
MLNRRRHEIRVFAYFLAEISAVLGSFLVAYSVRRGTSSLWGESVEPLRSYLWLLPVMAAVWSGLLWGLNTYEGFRSRSILRQGFLAAVTSALGMLVLFALVAVTKHSTNRSLIGVIGVVSFLGLFATRIAAAAFLSHYTLKGYDRHYVLIGGPPDEAVALAESLQRAPGAVFQVKGFVAEERGEIGKKRGRWEVLGTFEEVPVIAARDPVDEVYLLPRSGPLEAWRPLVEKCETMGITVHLRLVPFERLISRLSVGEIEGVEYLTFSTVPRGVVLLGAKRMLDVLGAVTMLIALSPVFFLVALLVRLTSRGPVVFRQDRAGMNGRIFTLYKFRTMVEGAEGDRAKLESQNEMDGPVFKIRQDPRVTVLGKFLRKSSIDELPQLWNVLKGDMSLVGPRPLPTYEVEKFESWQRRRMSMRPGITGLWQIQGRSRMTSFEEWMKLDLEYVDRWSLGLDLKILALTIPAVVVGKGAY